MSFLQLFVKNTDGEVVKGMPVRVTTAHSITVTAEPHPDSKQLMLDNEYQIKINIFNKDGRPVFPSPVIYTDIGHIQTLEDIISMI
jgi:hypothetical protein